MTLVLFRQDDFVGRNAPVDAEIRVVPCQCPLALRGIKVVAFILENNFRREHAEAVGKTAGDEELTMVFFCQLYSYMLTERLTKRRTTWLPMKPAPPVMMIFLLKSMMCCIIGINLLSNQTTIRHLSGEDDACPFPTG